MLNVNRNYLIEKTFSSTKWVKTANSTQVKAENLRKMNVAFKQTVVSINNHCSLECVKKASVCYTGKGMTNTSDFVYSKFRFRSNQGNCPLFL